MRENFLLPQCPSQSRTAPIGFTGLWSDSPHPKVFREILEGLVQEFSLGYGCQNIPPSPWKMNCRGAAQVEKKIPQAGMRPWIRAGCHCNHSLYWHCRAYCRWPVGIGFPEAQEIHFSSEGERSDTFWSSPEELWQMCHSNLTAPWENINSEVCWFLQAYFTPLST